MPCYYTYIITNKPNGTFYTGVTNDLSRRIYEHKEGRVKGFAQKYGLNILVYYEVFENIWDAIAQEKVIKRWKRVIKIERIRKMNPDWEDLYFML